MSAAKKPRAPRVKADASPGQKTGGAASSAIRDAVLKAAEKGGVTGKAAAVLGTRAEAFVATHREDTDDKLFGITELAAEFGLSPRAIRFYEDKGLLAPRRINGGRAYTRRDRVRLMLIQRGKAMGLALSEIQTILDLYGERGEGRTTQLSYLIERTDEAIAELEERRANVDATLAELRLINEGLKQELEERGRS